MIQPLHLHDLKWGITTICIFDKKCFHDHHHVDHVDDEKVYG